MANSEAIVVAIDAMGGDGSLAEAVEGMALAAKVARRRHGGARFLVYGDGALIEAALASRSGLGALASVCEVRHCDVAVKMDEPPAEAVWRGRRKASMWRAMEAVRDGEAQAAVSSGNTGAMTVMSQLVLRRMPGVDRHALAALVPKIQGGFNVVLDVGASFGADARRLAQHAVMGAAMAETLFGDERPAVGLLNIGKEIYKGEEALRDAAVLLDSSPAVDFVGFVEGDDIGSDIARVYVVDGFTGNIALKVGEGVLRYAGREIAQRFRSSLRGILAYFMARRHLRGLRDVLNPSGANGAVFLGLRGCVIKSHGSADRYGFAAAIERAIVLGRMDFVGSMGRALASLNAINASGGEAPVGLPATKPADKTDSPAMEARQ